MPGLSFENWKNRERSTGEELVVNLPRRALFNPEPEPDPVPTLHTVRYAKLTVDVGRSLKPLLKTPCHHRVRQLVLVANDCCSTPIPMFLG